MEPLWGVVIMSEAFNGARYCWMNGEIVETKDALVSAMEPIFLGIFEGIKAYVEGDVRGEGSLNIFQWKPHIDRLWRSADVHGLKIPYTKDELLEATRETIKANGFKMNVYIQPRIWPKAGSGLSRYFAEEFHVVIPTWLFNTRLGKGNPRFSEESHDQQLEAHLLGCSTPSGEVLGKLCELRTGDPRSGEARIRWSNIPRQKRLRL